MKMKRRFCTAVTVIPVAATCMIMAMSSRMEVRANEAQVLETAVTNTALPVKALRAKQVDENPYMAKSDANIHHDGYNTDTTDEVLPIGIDPEIHVSYETMNANASRDR